MPKKKTTKKSPLKPLRKKKKTSFFQTFLHKSSLTTKLLFFIGIILIIIPSIFYINETIQLSFFTPKVPHVVATSKTPPPTDISIPSVNIDLPIFPTALSGSTWQIAQNGISHLAISANPGEMGPIILYGHNTNDRFGPIRWLSQGEKIRITTADKKAHTYVITKTTDVSPNQTSALVNVKGETLILYTCDGFGDLQRFLVFATSEK